MAEKPTILIADDVELNRAILHDLFCHEFEILEAADGREAIAHIDAKQDLAMIFLDIIMPELDGFAVLQHLNDVKRIETTPVFLITVENSDEVINRGFNLGAVDVIPKPFNPTIIRCRAANMLELYKARHKMQSLIHEQSIALIDQANRLRHFSESVIDTLSTAIEFRDCESGGHIRRIRGITKLILNDLVAHDTGIRLSHDQIEQIATASAMHDIGKIATPDYILNKPGRLTAQEFEIMKEHPLKGCEILDRIDTLKKDALYGYIRDIARSHHEKYDGKGYPDGLKGTEIPIWAQAVGLADCYDALVSERVYKRAYSHDEAIQMLLDGECGAFSEMLKQCLLRIAQQLRGGSFHSPEMPSYKRKPIGNADRNVSDRALRLLEMERERYHRLMKLSNEALFTYYSDSHTLELSDRFLDYFGGEVHSRFDSEQMVNADYIHPEDYDGMNTRMRALTSEMPSCSVELRLKVKEGHYEWFKLYVRTFWDIDQVDHCTSVVGRVRSIDSFKREILLWKNQANVDALTGLLNRYGLTASIEQLITETPHKEKFALYMLDVDNFKQVNDTHGHVFGDRVLRKVADILRDNMRSTDIVGRIGGDEFVLVARNIDSSVIAKAKAKDILEQVARYSKRENLKISASVGVALYPRNGHSFKVLLDKADKALYVAKKNGKGDVCAYDLSIDAKNYSTMITKPDHD